MLMVPTREKFLPAVSQITLMLTVVILSRGKKKECLFVWPGAVCLGTDYSSIRGQWLRQDRQLPAPIRSQWLGKDDPTRCPTHCCKSAALPQVLYNLTSCLNLPLIKHSLQKTIRQSVLTSRALSLDKR